MQRSSDFGNISNISFSQLQEINEKNNSYQKNVYQMEKIFQNTILSPQPINQEMQQIKLPKLFNYIDFGIQNHLMNINYIQKQNEMQMFIQQKTLKNCDQRTEQWYNVRKTSFGGSEMANLMGNCKKSYKSQKAFLTEKIQNMTGKKNEQLQMQSQIIMDWGTFFEPLHRNIIEEIFKCQVVETSMCLGEGLLKGCHQSPDGLSVIRSDIFKQMVKTDHIINQEVFDQEYVSVLWEQKSPTLRTPEYGIIPDNYIGQVKLGLSVFGVCDIGCYSDSVFRMCSLRQMFTKTYNTGIIKRRSTGIKDEDPIFVGFLILDESSKLQLQQQNGDISINITDSVFQYIMNLVREGKFKVSYEIHKYNDSHAFQQTIKQRANQLGQTNAFICWKLVDINFTAVERSEGFKNVMSMFISIGRNILLEYQKKQELPQQSIKNINTFTALIKKLDMPMDPANRQDHWYQQNQIKLLQTFEEMFSDDWQSFFVLISLLQKSDDQHLAQKALKYIEDAVQVCKDDEQKKQQLYDILNQFGDVFNDYLQILVQQPPQDVQMSEEADSQVNVQTI